MEFGRSPHWTQSARIGSANAGLFLGCVLTAMSCTMVGLPTYSEGSEGSPAAVTVEAPAADLFAPAPPANGYDPQPRSRRENSLRVYSPLSCFSTGSISASKYALCSSSVAMDVTICGLVLNRA